jgi:hypothetical protein
MKEASPAMQFFLRLMSRNPQKSAEGLVYLRSSAEVAEVTGKIFSNEKEIQSSAIAHAPQKIAEYFAWLKGNADTLPAIHEPIEVEVVEIFHSFTAADDPDYIVNAFFEDDRRELGYWDVEIALRLLDWTRRDLLEVIRALTSVQLTQILAGEVRGSIAGILEHVASAENWYFHQIGYSVPQVQLPNDPLEKLEAIRANTRSQAPRLIGDDRIHKNHDELWSGRKILRRTLWHERDHTAHILKLIEIL